jgi:hypothetical protein
VGNVGLLDRDDEIALDREPPGGDPSDRVNENSL